MTPVKIASSLHFLISVILLSTCSSRQASDVYEPYELQDIKTTKECQGILQPQAYTLEENDTESLLLKHEDLKSIPQNRLYLYIPRFGMGNSLRAYPASLIFSLLSGRKLVLTYQGAHWKVVHHLCKSFHCRKDIYDERERFPDVRPRIVVFNNSTLIRSLLHDNRSLLGEASAWEYDGYWMQSKELSACVMALFRCSTKWCVHSRSFQNLLRGPTLASQKLIENILVGQTFVSGNKTIFRTVKAGHASNLRFDFAIHIRTVTRYMEGFSQCNTSDEKCRDTEQRELQEEKEIFSIFLNKYLFACLRYFLETFQLKVTDMDSNWDDKDSGDRLMSEESSSETPRRPHIFLATDHVDLRPKYVNFLKEFGWVYSSTAEIVHTSKQKGLSEGASSTVTEFYLMSRSNVILEVVGKFVSTFAMTAAKLGNSTFIAMNYSRSSCNLVYMHKF